MGSPLASILSTPSGNGGYSLLASSHGADSHARQLKMPPTLLTNPSVVKLKRA
jgi:hypothetical protein